MRRLRRLTAAAVPAALVVAVCLAEPAADDFQARSLDDQSRLSSWTLPSGLRVVVRELPGARHVAIATAFPVGADHDPPGREGAARLMAELYFTAGTGLLPDRTRAELDHLRPDGWGVQVSPRLTLFTEVVTPAQFPEVLRQTAARLDGVQLTPALLKRARATVTEQLGDVHFRNPATALYYEVRDEGRDRLDERMVTLATGKGIAAITLAEARRRLERHYGPARAVLSVAGDVRTEELRGMVQSFFGPLAARGEAPDAPADSLTPGYQAGLRGTVGAPVGVVGVIAPALADTLHPAFYLASLLLGSAANHSWGAAGPPLATRFEYRLFDDPSLARFYPPPDPSDPSGRSLSVALSRLADQARESPVPRDQVETLRASLDWLLGGPLRPALRQQLPHEPTLPATVANNAAVRELWGGEGFWAAYRERFMRTDRADWDRALRMLGEQGRHIARQFNPRGSAAR